MIKTRWSPNARQTPIAKIMKTTRRVTFALTSWMAAAGIAGGGGAVGGMGGLGCAAAPTNPAFPVTSAQAEADVKRMEAKPQALPRPVVMLTGWADPFFGSAYWKETLRATGVPRDQILPMSFFFHTTFPGCRERVIAAVQERWPSDDPAFTVEVDVVGFSMGGLIARLSAAPPSQDDGNPRRLKIARLFTIATPHRGARIAKWSIDPIMIDRRVAGMKPGSATLAYLDEQRGRPGNDYRIVAYARTKDWVVGNERTAPPGKTAYWVPTPFLHRPHQEAYRDPRIEADILRRLRGETPLTAETPAPWPE